MSVAKSPVKMMTQFHVNRGSLNVFLLNRRFCQNRRGNEIQNLDLHFTFDDDFKKYF